MGKIIQYRLNNLIYLHFKKHFCPHCGCRLRTGYIVETVGTATDTYVFGFGNYIRGNVEYRTGGLWCPECELSITVDEMKKYERGAGG